MLIIDRMLVGGVRFILKKIADAAEAELDDDTVLREELLKAEMQLELGEITAGEFAEIERVLLDRIRQIQERRSGGQPLSPLDARVTGVEAHVGGDEKK